MNIIEQGEAISLSIQSSEKKGREKKRLFSLCRERFQSAILSIPDDEDTLVNYGNFEILEFSENFLGNSLVTKGLSGDASPSEKLELLTAAFENYKTASSYS
jgi:hypothetical protein